MVPWRDSTPSSGSGSRESRDPGAAPRRSRWATCASASRAPAVRCWPAMWSYPATAERSGTARPPSRCICCAGSCAARTFLSDHDLDAAREPFPRAVDHEVGLLVDHEVAGVGYELDTHVVRVGLVSWQQPGGEGDVALAEEEQRRRGQPMLPPSAADALAEGALVVAVELDDRLGAGGLLEAPGVHLHLLIAERGPQVAASQIAAGDPLLAQDPPAEAGSRDDPRVPAAPRLHGDARRQARPRMRRVARHHAIDAIRMEDAEEERRPAAPVVPDDVRALQPQGVEQGDLVGGEGLAVVAAPGRLRPAEAAQVGSEQPVLVPEAAHHPPPHVPVLRPAVQEQYGRRVCGAGLGDVDADPVRLHETVLDALDCRN